MTTDTTPATCKPCLQVADLVDELYALQARLDALEEHVKTQLTPFYEAYYRQERKRVEQARYMAARNGGELISRRDMMRQKGVTAERVREWVKDPRFPVAVQQSRGRTWLYDRVAFEAWYEEYRQRPKVRAGMERGQK